MSPAPWSAPEVDPDEVLAVLHAQFPQVPTWRGDFTGSWWALLRGRLVEARDPRQLAEYIRAVLTSARPASPWVPGHRVPQVIPGTAERAPRPVRAPVRPSVRPALPSVHMARPPRWRRVLRRVRWFFLEGESWE
ncbi:hypothetical protein [Actinomadura harenae]|uniref:Uncharacterized protein n=1 Tax=Actinomadura harenae TaxID=2483351 RepID=A0A3M2M562_9ACTN|nr:hypothetical protein [Actinomadura harenae]RMI44719.1 hypothetical protein EBO15_12260 [Actinomadura harenae]